MIPFREVLSPVFGPTLLLDERRARRNIDRMVRRARRAGLRLRPHFKTHQSAAVAEWFREAGIESIAVSSWWMARYFAEAGWDDITLALPLDPGLAEHAASLAAEVRLGVLVDSAPPIYALHDALGAAALRVWLKVDVGYGRVGVPWDAPDRVVALARTIAGTPGCELAGLLTHAGHTYRAAGPEEILAIHARCLERLRLLRAELAEAGLPPVEVSVGDTPSCSLATDFLGADEMRPGNFVFHDLMQMELGVCGEEDIAVAVACPVLGVYPERGEIVVHGGAVHLGLESLPGPGGARVHGYLATLAEDSFGGVDRDAPVVSLSQEHGVVRLAEERLAELAPGDWVLVLPVHSCLTCNLHQRYVTLTGEVLARRPL